MRRSRNRWALVATSVGAALVLTACGSSGHGGHSMGGSDNGDHASVDFGEVAEASEATREIEIDALDRPAFQPASLEVAVGDVVTFVITNRGENEHEFVLGDEHYQQDHAEMMEGSEPMEHSGNAVEIAPGDRATLTWRFTRAGEVLFGCHEPGHYDGGMVGVVEVAA